MFFFFQPDKFLVIFSISCFFFSVSLHRATAVSVTSETHTVSLNISIKAGAPVALKHNILGVYCILFSVNTTETQNNWSLLHCATRRPLILAAVIAVIVILI